MRKVLCEWNQEEIDELATETCECVNARIYTHKKSQKERAHNKIDLLFGENNCETSPSPIVSRPNFWRK